MLRLISASLTLMATSATVAAQPLDLRPGLLSLSIAAGPTRSFRGVDAPGVQGQAGLARHLGKGFGVILEGVGHWYEVQPLYPCLIQDAARCYQTMRRAVAAGILSATYAPSRFRTDAGRSGPYLISGIGMYKSRRIATRYSDCQPSGPCDRDTYRLELRDTQFGWSGGVGLDHYLGRRVGVFAETRVHYIYNDQPGAQPSNDYFVWPLALGLRF